MTKDNEDALEVAQAVQCFEGCECPKNEAAAHLRRLVRENEAMRKSAPLCEKHQPSGGTRSNCLVCVGERLQASLSRISYVCGDPNEMEVSSYDAHYDEASVVEQVRSLRAQNEAKDALLRQAVEALEQAKHNTTHGQIAWNCKEAIAAIRQHLEGRA